MSLPRPRKRSAQVLLLMSGTLLVAACEQPRSQFRDLYASREDCEGDWGQAVACEPASDVDGGQGRLWYGPGYGYDEREPRTNGRDHSIGVHEWGADGRPRYVSREATVRRAGFGFFGGGHSGGG